MARPNTAAFGELILPVFTQWEKVGSVSRILDELEQGVFYDAALLVDQMMRDDRIRASFNTRFFAVLGKPMHMECDKETAKAERIEEDALKLWPRMAPRAELLTHLKYGYMLGASVARREWVRTASDWIPTLKVWHPGALRFDLMSSTYRLRTVDKGEIEILPDDPNWDLFTPFGHKYGRIEGMVRPLSMLYLCRQWAFRDRARHSEVHGLPMRQIIAPAQADADDKRLARLKAGIMGAESVLVTPQGEDGNKWDLKIVEAGKDSNEVFGQLINHVDDCIAIFALGQTTSTKGQPGLGSQQNAGDSVRGDIMRWDAEVIGDLSERHLRQWVDANHGVAATGLRVCIEVDPPKDGAQKAQELSTLGDAAEKLERFGVDVRALLEDTGVPMLSLAEAAAKRAELVAEAQAALTPADAETPVEDKAPVEESEPKALSLPVEPQRETLLSISQSLVNFAMADIAVDVPAILAANGIQRPQ